MPQTKKQKEKQMKDFKKVKLKVGKTLKKTNTTDTTIKSKRLVLASQLEEKKETGEKPLSYRGLSLDELCKQLGHFNKSIRKDALTGAKQLLTSRPDLIAIHLRTLIPSVARLLSETNDNQIAVPLKNLLTVICTAPAHAMSAHFTLFIAHILRALTHMEMSIRNLAVTVLSMVMTSYPKLCGTSMDLFQSFVKFLGSPRKPAWNSPKFLETLHIFMKVYDCSSAGCNIALQEKTLSFETNTTNSQVDMVKMFKKVNPFDFPVVSTSVTANASPFELPESILSLSAVLCPLLTAVILEDTAGKNLTVTLSILRTVSWTVDNQPNAFIVKDFERKLYGYWSTVKKAAQVRKCKQILEATAWIR
ncbi:unnamed protein product [Auanema sp. JU1783]|nr:unnamed protein product [Auanema sp. JU1783]